MTEPLLTPRKLDPNLVRFVLHSRAEQFETAGYPKFRETMRLMTVFEEAGRFMETLHHFRGLEEAGVPKPEIPLMNDSVYQVLHAMQYEFPFSKITILKILPHDLPSVKIERDHLDILLFNLIDYARQALGQKGGIITIEGAEKIYLSPENTSRHRFILRISHARLVGREELTGGFVDYLEPIQPLEDLPETAALYLARKIVEYNRGFFRMEMAGRTSSFHLEFPI